RKQIVEIMGSDLRHVQDLKSRIVHIKLSRRFAFGRHRKDDLDSVNGALFARFADEVGWWNQRQTAQRDRLAEATVHLAACSFGEQRPKLVERTTTLRISGNHALTDRVFQKALWREKGDPSRSNVGFGCYTFDTAPVVGVCMGVDDGDDRSSWTMLIVQVQRGLRGFHREKGVDHDQSRIAFQNGHVGKVDAANLINPVDDLEQPVLMVELRLPPEAGIDRVGRRFVEERIILLAPDHTPVRSGYEGVGQRSDEAARGILKVVLLVERELRKDGMIQSLDGRFRRLLLTESR